MEFDIGLQAAAAEDGIECVLYDLNGMANIGEWHLKGNRFKCKHSLYNLDDESETGMDRKVASDAYGV